MYFSECLCDILRNNTDSKTRMEELERKYKEKVGEVKWELALPILGEIVEAEFEDNYFIEASSTGGTFHGEVYVHIGKIKHNKDLIILILSLARIWDESETLTRRPYSVASGNGAMEDFIEKVNVRYVGYEGNLSEDFRKATVMNEDTKELLDRKYYYLSSYSLTDSDDNLSGSGWGIDFKLRRVIIW